MTPESPFPVGDRDAAARVRNPQRTSISSTSVGDLEVEKSSKNALTKRETKCDPDGSVGAPASIFRSWVISVANEKSTRNAVRINASHCSIKSLSSSILSFHVKALRA